MLQAELGRHAGGARPAGLAAISQAYRTLRRMTRGLERLLENHDRPAGTASTGAVAAPPPVHWRLGGVVLGDLEEEFRRRRQRSRSNASVWLIAAAAAANGLRAMLYQVEPHDALTYGSVMLLLIVAAAAAAFVPAVRAARVDPAGLLR